MNNFVSWVSHQEGFILRNVSFGILFVIVSYLMIISLFTYFKKPSYSRLILVLISVLMIQGAFIFENYRNQSSEFIVFHKSKSSLIGMKYNETLTVASNLDSLTKSRDNIIQNYKVGHSISSIENIEIGSVYEFNNTKFLIIDSLGVYKVKSFKPDFVLLRNSPKLNLTRMIDSLSPKLIIADGSNFKSYTERWKQTCEKQNIPFHQTSEKGAFICKY
jgi:competence protein ComEC